MICPIYSCISKILDLKINGDTIFFMLRHCILVVPEKHRKRLNNSRGTKAIQHVTNMIIERSGTTFKMAGLEENTVMATRFSNLHNA